MTGWCGTWLHCGSPSLLSQDTLRHTSRSRMQGLVCGFDESWLTSVSRDGILWMQMMMMTAATAGDAMTIAR